MRKNYGQIRVAGKTLLAHRFGFTCLVRPLRADETVDHLCHNRDADCPGGKACEHRACQNPAHWEAVDGPSNYQRAWHSRSVEVTRVRDLAVQERARARFR